MNEVNDNKSTLLGAETNNNYYNYDNSNKPKLSRKALWGIIIAACAIIVVLIVVSIFAFLQNGEDKDLKKAKDEFLPPAQVVEIDYSSDDPSNDQITFGYDEFNRVEECRYFIKEREYVQNNIYNYESQIIEIKVFYKDYIIIEEEFDYIDISSGEKFTTVEDYYISSPDYKEVTSAITDEGVRPTGDWKQLYKDRINKYMNEESVTDDVQFSLILIDDNDVPELLISLPSHATASLLCWVYDDTLYEEYSGYTISQGITYIEKTGYVRVNSIYQGAGGDSIYELYHSSFSELCSGEVDEMNNEYTWDNRSVSKEEYYNSLNELFDTDVAKDSVEVIYSIDEIMTAIDEYGTNETEEIIVDDEVIAQVKTFPDVLYDGYWVDYSPQSEMFSTYTFDGGTVIKTDYSFLNSKVEYITSETGSITIRDNNVTAIFDEYTITFEYVADSDEMHYTIYDDPFYEGTYRVFHYDTLPSASVAKKDSKNRVV